jgi:hypothetical protein
MAILNRSPTPVKENKRDKRSQSKAGEPAAMDQTKSPGEMEGGAVLGNAIAD